MRNSILIISFFFLTSFQSKDGFVISCGGGCAMVYNVEKISVTGTIYKVKIKMSNYINEKIVEETHQLYFFEYEKNGTLIKVYNKANNENILIDKNDLSKDEFEKLGKRLWKNENAK
jgi:hypothetical protein